MTKTTTGYNLPLITVRRATPDLQTTYVLQNPDERTDFIFQNIVDVIRVLRKARYKRAYIIDGNECFWIDWGPIVPPWEGPPT